MRNRDSRRAAAGSRGSKRQRPSTRACRCSRSTPRAGASTVTLEPFESFAEARLDLLFVADEEARGELAATAPAATLRAMKRLIRRGNVMFFVFRTRHELQDAGYEDFLDSLGLAFLGACR